MHEWRILITIFFISPSKWHLIFYHAVILCGGVVLVDIDILIKVVFDHWHCGVEQ